MISLILNIFQWKCWDLTTTYYTSFISVGLGKSVFRDWAEYFSLGPNQGGPSRIGNWFHIVKSNSSKGSIFRSLSLVNSLQNITDIQKQGWKKKIWITGQSPTFALMWSSLRRYCSKKLQNLIGFQILKA